MKIPPLEYILDWTNQSAYFLKSFILIIQTLTSCHLLQKLENQILGFWIVKCQMNPEPIHVGTLSLWYTRTNLGFVQNPKHDDDLTEPLIGDELKV